MPRKTKKLLVISDLHCGHRASICPPSWHFDINEDSAVSIRTLVAIRNTLWGFFEKKIKKLKPIDTLLINGDCIDGKGHRSGGVELLTSDRNEQANMAAEIIDYINPKRTIITYGTPYHTGNNEDFEDQVAEKTGATISGHEIINANGCIIDMRHYVGRSSVPHSRHTAIAREHLWNALEADHGDYPKANIVIRSHVHYFNYCGGSDWLGMTTPALQAPGTKFGIRKCSGTVDFGMVNIDIKPSGSYTWNSHILEECKHHEVTTV